jgi:hypothetical protein
MDKLYLIIITIIVLYFLLNRNIEKFTLNFPENELKCKCDMEEVNESTNEVKSNNVIEKFTNYDNSEIEQVEKLDRIYNIHKSPYNESASNYFEKKYSYPIKPLELELEIEPSNSNKYKNIGTSSDKLLTNYENNDLVSYNYLLGLNWQSTEQ